MRDNTGVINRKSDHRGAGNARWSGPGKEYFPVQNNDNTPLDPTANFLRLAADLRRLIDLAWPSDIRRCQHKYATMVQHDQGDGWYITWQCDDCGMPDRDRPVTTDDLAHGHDLPWFDREACLRGIERLAQRDSITAMFFGKARRR